MNAYLALDDDSIQRIKKNNPQLEKILGEFLMNRLLQMMIWKLNLKCGEKLWEYLPVTFQ